MSQDTNVPKSVMTFRLSSEMDAIFVHFSKEID